MRRRWRLISIRPKGEILPIWTRARSVVSASFSIFSTARLFFDFIHVDEVDDDQAGQVAQAQLAGGLLGRLHVGLAGRGLDVALLGGAARS